MILDKKYAALLSELREKQDKDSLEQFSEAFNETKPEIGAKLRDRIDAEGIKLIDILSAQEFGMYGALSKAVAGKRPFSLNIPFIQKLADEVMKQTIDEWILGADIPIECPKAAAVFLERYAMLPQLEASRFLNKLRRNERTEKADTREIIAWRIQEAMRDKGIPFGQLLRAEETPFISAIKKMRETAVFNGRLTTLAYIAVVKLNVSLDYLMDANWSHKNILMPNGKKLTSHTRRVLSIYLSQPFELQQETLVEIITKTM